MKYILMLLVFAGCTAPYRAEVRYEIICPINMVTTKVDTIVGTDYYYSTQRLNVLNNKNADHPNRHWVTEYPSNCVITPLNKN
jgi:hypothetical protein